jgi:predicted RNA-binding Zn ribbon-like protein
VFVEVTGLGDARLMQLIGGHVAVDFVNTLGGLPERADDEYLFDYGDLVNWLDHVDLLPPDRRRDLVHAAEDTPAEAAGVLEEVRRLRDSLDHILRCRLTAEPAGDTQLHAVRAAYAEAVQHATLMPDTTSYQLDWHATDRRVLRWPLWVLAAAALDLLTDAPLDLLGRCEHCRWLFLDRSRNHSRRWCSMNACGAVVKMRRHRGARGSVPAVSGAEPAAARDRR